MVMNQPSLNLITPLKFLTMAYIDQSAPYTSLLKLNHCSSITVAQSDQFHYWLFEEKKSTSSSYPVHKAHVKEGCGQAKYPSLEMPFLRLGPTIGPKLRSKLIHSKANCIACLVVYVMPIQKDAQLINVLSNFQEKRLCSIFICFAVDRYSV